MRTIDLFKVHMAPTVSDEVAKVLNSGYIGQGPKVEEFETALRKHFNHDHLVTLNSGTSGLHLALHLLKKPDENEKYIHGSIGYSSPWIGIEDGDEVLSTALTCTATNWPILANGLKVKWVDIDPGTLNMDLDDLERKIGPKTKVIMVVHWGGYPNNLERIKEIQKKSEKIYGFKPAVIEDAAHAFGSKYNNRLIGTHGNLTVFSLQAIKHVTAIDGGILISPFKKLNDRAKLIRWYGIDREGDRKDFRCETDIEEWGYKFHMNDVCATVGIENLKHGNQIVQKHRNNAHYYDKHLKDIPGVSLLKREPGFESSFWIYSFVVENREGFYKHMRERGISVSQVHERNDKHTCVKSFRSNLPNLDKVINKVVSIPVGWWVSEEDRSYIVECIKAGW